MGWGGRWEGGSGWGTHVHPWLIHINVWQKPLQYCKVISLHLVKIIGGKKRVYLLLFSCKSCLTLAAPWTAACQAPLCMGFPRQEYWSGLPIPSPTVCVCMYIYIYITLMLYMFSGVGCHFLLQGIFPTQGLNLGLPHCRQMLLLSEIYF